VLRASHVRRPTITLDTDSQAYGDFLMEQALQTIAETERAR
jgi:hypothetical protein